MDKLIDSEKIIEFVKKIESKKGYKRDPNYVFRHIVSEIGELDKAMWENEQAERTYGLSCTNIRYIAEEIVDIIFLACYMADLYGFKDINHIIKKRMEDISKQYGVEL